MCLQPLSFYLSAAGGKYHLRSMYTTPGGGAEESVARRFLASSVRTEPTSSRTRARLSYDDENVNIPLSSTSYVGRGRYVIYICVDNGSCLLDVAIEDGSTCHFHLFPHRASDPTAAMPRRSRQGSGQSIDSSQWADHIDDEIRRRREVG